MSQPQQPQAPSQAIVSIRDWNTKSVLASAAYKQLKLEDNALAESIKDAAKGIDELIDNLKTNEAAVAKIDSTARQQVAALRQSCTGGAFENIPTANFNQKEKDTLCNSRVALGAGIATALVTGISGITFLSLYGAGLTPGAPTDQTPTNATMDGYMNSPQFTDVSNLLGFGVVGVITCFSGLSAGIAAWWYTSKNLINDHIERVEKMSEDLKEEADDIKKKILDLRATVRQIKTQSELAANMSKTYTDLAKDTQDISNRLARLEDVVDVTSLKNSLNRVVQLTKDAVGEAEKTATQQHSVIFGQVGQIRSILLPVIAQHEGGGDSEAHDNDADAILDNLQQQVQQVEDGTQRFSVFVDAEKEAVDEIDSLVAKLNS